MLFMHMTEFSMFNNPPMKVTKETITILSVAFPESLGTCVIMNAPAAFRLLWSAVSGFIDPKTKSKVFLLSGDISDGSANDETMRRIVGDSWKELTGAGQPVLSSSFNRKSKRVAPASPGFDPDRYWPTVLEREAAWAAKLADERAALRSGDNGRGSSSAAAAAAVGSPSPSLRSRRRPPPNKAPSWRGSLTG